MVVRAELFQLVRTTEGLSVQPHTRGRWAGQRTTRRSASLPAGLGVGHFETCWTSGSCWRGAQAADSAQRPAPSSPLTPGQSPPAAAHPHTGRRLGRHARQEEGRQERPRAQGRHPLPGRRLHRLGAAGECLARACGSPSGPPHLGRPPGSAAPGVHASARRTTPQPPRLSTRAPHVLRDSQPRRGAQTDASPATRAATRLLRAHHPAGGVLGAAGADCVSGLHGHRHALRRHLQAPRLRRHGPAELPAGRQREGERACASAFCSLLAAQQHSSGA